MNTKFMLVFLFLFLLIASCSEPVPLELNEGRVESGMHQDYLGQIVFMGDYIPFSEFKPSDIPTHLTFSNSSTLYMRMFLGKTLTYYMHELAPGLSVRELCDKGNFQLTFYVDKKQLYQYNLQTGAGSCEYKNSQLIYGVPLAEEEDVDHWGRFLWMKFMKREGGEKALGNGSHELKIEVRPYIDHEDLKVGEIIAQGAVRLTKVEKEVEESQMAIQAIQATEKWPLAESSYDEEYIKQLNKKIAQNYFKKITSIAVIKDGKLLIEEYFDGADRSTLHDTRSVGKTLASTLMGIAIEEGHLKNESMTLGDFYDLSAYKNYSKAKETVTLRSLLTMSAPFLGNDSDPDSPGNEENMYPTSNWVKFTLDLPIDEGKTMEKDWAYFTAGVVVLGDVLNSSVPGGLEQYAAKKLFEPLGISNYKWVYTPQKVPSTAGGYRTSTLDFAKYGQLYLSQGMIDGKRIVSESWIKTSMTKYHAVPNNENTNYGYLLWNKTYTVDDQNYETYFCSGNGGNKIMVFPELNSVIVITATAYGQAYAHLQADEIVGQYLLPVLVNMEAK